MDSAEEYRGIAGITDDLYRSQITSKPGERNSSETKCRRIRIVPSRGVFDGRVSYARRRLARRLAGGSFSPAPPPPAAA
jgi:hypothetical protein